ncbi:unnamed protein product [Protopolystoma xenopodis]|uniref:Uncharacterized protein n=1 Tax=Protopolystoma xenopodis TaxID=117903 RepID=A0A3S5CRM9_9PLAT|nr:unnamed protein product [Protopolystoma xenopodis]
MNLPVKPIDSWSRGIRRRLLVESNFESLHPHESSSKANRQLVKRNPPSSSGGTAMNLPVKPIDSWSRGIRRRLLVEPSFESLHPTLSLEMKVSSTSSSVCQLFT